MSIGAFVLEPKDSKNSNLYLPVATEKGFYDFWFPLIKKLKLDWLEHMSFGLEVTNKNLNEVLEELNKLNTYLVKNEISGWIGLQERIIKLSKMLEKVFQEKDIVVYIG